MAGHLIRVDFGPARPTEDYVVGLAHTARAICCVRQYCGGHKAWSVTAYSDEELWQMWGVEKGKLKRVSAD